jgi:hypothetical protein
MVVVLDKNGETAADFAAVTNALSGLVGVGGLFVMGGGWVPHTFPQVLAAASVFLANVSKYQLLVHVFSVQAQTRAQASSSKADSDRHFWRFLDYKTNVRPL